MALGGSTDAELLQSRMDNLNPSNCCSVIYTNDVSARALLNN